MAVSRFFNPSRGVYQSQFVPEELPTDLMLGALQQKQKQYDIADAAMVELGDWNQRALEGYDTGYVKNKKTEIEQFINDNMGKDFTSPEFQRQYRDFNKKFKGDEGLKSVQAAVEKDDAFKLRYNALKQDPKTEAFAEAFANDYLTRRSKYTAQEGLGFTGDIALGDENMLTGVNKTDEFKRYFDDLKSSGSDVMKDLEGITYKDSWTGVGGTKIKDRVKQMLDTAFESRLGKQVQEEIAMKVFGTEVPSIQIANMSEDQKKQYDQYVKTEFAKEFRAAGGEFEYGVSKSDKDAAAAKVYEEKKQYAQQDELVVSGGTTGYTMPSLDEAIGNPATGDKGMFAKNKDNIVNYKQTLNDLKVLATGVNTGSIKKDDRGRPILNQQQLSMIEGLPGATKFINGQPLTQQEKELFNNSINNNIESNNYKLNNSLLLEKEYLEKNRNAASFVLGDKKYGNSNFKELYDKKDQLQKDPTMAEYVKKYDALQSKEHQQGEVVTFIGIQGTQKGTSTASKDGTIFLNNEIKRLTNLALSEKDMGKRVALTSMVGKLKDLKNFDEASNDFKQAISTNPEKAKEYKEHFNNTNTFVPLATVVPELKDGKYMSYSVDAKGQPVKLGLVTHPDKMVEGLVKKDPSAFIIIDQDTGEIINKTITTLDKDGNSIVVPNPDYPQGTSMKMVSSNNQLLRDYYNGDKIGTKAQFNFTAEEAQFEAMVDPSNPDKFKTIKTVKPKRYTVVLAGSSVKQYADMKYKYHNSNYLLNPNSPEGQKSKQQAEVWKNPEKSHELTKYNALAKDGESAYSNRTFYNTKTQQAENHNIKVTKSKDGQNNYLVEINDGDGNIEKYRVKNVDEIGKTLDFIEEQTKATVEKAKSMGIQPDVKEIIRKKSLYETTKDPNVLPGETDIKTDPLEFIFNPQSYQQGLKDLKAKNNTNYNR